MSGVYILRKVPDGLDPKMRSVQIGRVCEELELLAHNKAWRVEVSEHRLARSGQQNRYYWGVAVKLISEEIGYEADEVHEFLCGTIFGWKDKRVPKTPRNPAGLESVPVRTTTVNEFGERQALNKQQFTDYIEAVRRFASQRLGLDIPDPEGGAL